MKCMLLVVAGLTMSAHGQMLTPPPATVPAPDAHIEKTPPRPRPVPTQLTPEQMKAAQPIQPAKERSPKSGWTKPADLPKLDHKPLAERDANGAILPLTEPMELLALRRNPMLPSNFFEDAKWGTYAADRRATVERLVVDLLDVCEKVDGGYVEQADLGGADAKAVLANLSNTLRPLSVGADTSKGGIKSMLIELYDREMLNKDQAGYSDLIVNEYTKELFRGLTTTDLMKVVLKNPTTEPMFAYRALMAEAAGSLVKAAESIELDDAARAAIKSSAASYGAGLDQAQKIKVYKDATAGLTLEQRQRLLRKVIELRGAK
ncbi:MAG: hypothetical protein DYG92_02200 [Leptolyngbya sp. PLA1]|nr:hypothetical protein [Leptolyngbya sp. PLA1]